MFTSRSTTKDLVGRVARLPDEYMVRRVLDQWAVAGPTGLFVVGRADADLAASAHRTASMAHQLRAMLSNEVPWVPFVDALLVADGEGSGLECTVVDLDMLEMMLTGGAPAIDEVSLHQIKRHLPGIVADIQSGTSRPLHQI
ncbi:hypothetical protein BH10ACT3_BH10ACT3_04280 [soil metagenome]